MIEALVFFGFITLSGIAIALVAFFAFIILEITDASLNTDFIALIIGIIVYVIVMAAIFLSFKMRPENFGYQKIVEEETVEDSPDIPEYVYVMDQNGELRKVEVNK